MVSKTIITSQIIDKTTDQFSKDVMFHGANSAAIMIYKAGKIEYYKSTNHKWQDFYSSSKSARNCHVAAAGFDLLGKSKKSFTLVWDAMHPNNDDSIYLNEQRESFNHCHGLSICETLPNDIIFSIILTSDKKNEKFSELVLRDKSKVINYMQQLKYIDEYFILKNTKTAIGE